MSIGWLLILLGIVLLYIGAELLIHSAVQLALHFNIPRLIIGLTIVAFATSAPEALVSIFGQLEGTTGDIALGNVLGSDISNVGLVLGVYLLFLPCEITSEIKWRKMPLLFIVYLLLFLVMLGGKIVFLEGLFLFFVLILYILLQYFFPSKKEVVEEIKLYEEIEHPPIKITLQIFSVVASAILLIAGAHLMIDGSIKIAKEFGISERVIAFSILAFGTSLPELATAFIAAIRKQEGIIVGTVIGSSIFNSLLIIPCATLVKPIVFSRKILYIDFPIMIGFTTLLWILMVLGKDYLSRLDGSILLSAYLGYVLFLYLS